MRTLAIRPPTVWLLALLLVVLASCADDDPDRVLVVGDSVTGLIADDMVERDLDAFRITLRATNGGTSDEMDEVAAGLDDRHYDQVIVNLGTNDALDDVPFERTSAALDDLVARYDDASCIHLTTVNEHVLSFGDEGLPDRVRRINGHLEELVAGDDRISLIDWSAEVGGYQARGEPDGPLLIDTVHPTEVGQQLLLDQYADALRRCD